MKIDEDTILTRNPDIVFSEIDEEVVMMGPDFEKYFGMDSCAARIWVMLDEETTFAQLCERLVEEFAVTPEQCVQETRAFLEDLYERKLVVIGPQAVEERA